MGVTWLKLMIIVLVMIPSEYTTGMKCVKCGKEFSRVWIEIWKENGVKVNRTIENSTCDDCFKEVSDEGSSDFGSK
jgi:hypothetical protein